MLLSYSTTLEQERRIFTYGRFFSTTKTSDVQYHQSLSDSYQDAWHISRVFTESQIQAEKEIYVYAAKQEISTQQRIHRDEEKRWKRIAENERSRNIYDSVTITSEGEITATVCNLYDNAPARTITNMRSPKLTYLLHLGNQAESAYKVTANVANSPVTVYFDSHKIGNGSYLVKRFATQGIIFLAKAASQKKEYAQLLFTVLLTQRPQSVFVPDNPGWTDFPDNGFKFIFEEELTWNKIKLDLKN